MAAANAAKIGDNPLILLPGAPEGIRTPDLCLRSAVESSLRRFVRAYFCLLLIDYPLIYQWILLCAKAMVIVVFCCRLCRAAYIVLTWCLQEFRVSTRQRSRIKKEKPAWR